MVLANSKTHIEPLDTFHDAGAHDLDILLKGTIVHQFSFIRKYKTLKFTKACEINKTSVSSSFKIVEHTRTSFLLFKLPFIIKYYVEVVEGDGRF